MLSIWVEPSRPRFRIIGEEKALGLFSPEMFEIVSSKVPGTWVITSPKPGCFSLQPEAWSRLGFWEEYYDGEPKARACFEEERKKIIDSDP